MLVSSFSNGKLFKPSGLMLIVHNITLRLNLGSFLKFNLVCRLVCAIMCATYVKLNVILLLVPQKEKTTFYFFNTSITVLPDKAYIVQLSCLIRRIGGAVQKLICK